MMGIFIARGHIASPTRTARETPEPERESLDAYRCIPNEPPVRELDAFEGLDLIAWDQQALLEIEATERHAASNTELQSERTVLEKLAALTTENDPWQAAQALFGTERS